MNKVSVRVQMCLVPALAIMILVAPAYAAVQVNGSCRSVALSNHIHH
jgi:hypothetical protein